LRYISATAANAHRRHMTTGARGMATALTLAADGRRRIATPTRPTAIPSAPALGRRSRKKVLRDGSTRVHACLAHAGPRPGWYGRPAPS